MSLKKDYEDARRFIMIITMVLFFVIFIMSFVFLFWKETRHLFFIFLGISVLSLALYFLAKYLFKDKSLK